MEWDHGRKFFTLTSISSGGHFQSVRPKRLRLSFLEIYCRMPDALRGLPVALERSGSASRLTLAELGRLMKRSLLSQEGY